MHTKLFLKILSVIASVVICVYPTSSVNAYDVPEIKALDGAILITADTGSVLYENNAQKTAAVASTTKILSTLIALEYPNLDEQFRVDSNAIRVEGSSMGLKDNDLVTMRDLCYGMILPSGNDAANAAAVKIAGSIDNFVGMMNEKASMLGMTSTHFETPSGLDDGKNHYSTAKDMAVLTMEAMKNKDFCEIASSSSKTLKFGNPPYERTLYNHNKLLKMYDGACGVKTGFTDKAGRCLVAAACRDGVTLISVVLNDANDWNDTMNLFDYGFSKVKSSPLPSDFTNMKLPVVGGESLHFGVTSDDPPSIASNDNIKGKIKYVVKTDPLYYAPIKKGDKVGEVVYYYDNTELSTINLYSNDNINIFEDKAGLLGVGSKFNSFLTDLHLIKNLTST